MYQVKDKRKYPFFIIDNDILLKFGDKMGPYGIAVYCAIAVHTNKRDKAFPSRARIANMTGMSEKQVSRMFAALQELGLIIIDERPGTSHLITLLDTDHIVMVDSQSREIDNPGLTDQGGGTHRPGGIDQESREQESLKGELLNKKNGDRKKIDPLNHLQSYAEDEVSEATASNPADQWITYRNEVLDSYVSQTGIKLNQGQKGELALLPDVPVFDIRKYHQYLAEFTARGGYAYDVKAFCEGYTVYQKTGDIYEAMGRKRQAEPDKPKEREYPELNHWVGPDGTEVTW